MPVSVNTDLKEPESQKLQKPMVVIKNGEKLKKFTDTACTLLARDWKGPSNYGTTEVLEIETER